MNERPPVRRRPERQPKMELRACLSHAHTQAEVPFYYEVLAGTNPPCKCGRKN